MAGADEALSLRGPPAGSRRLSNFPHSISSYRKDSLGALRPLPQPFPAMSPDNTLTRLRTKFADLAPEWKFLAMISLALAFFLVPRAPSTWEEPEFVDREYVLYPGGEVLTTPTLTLEGAWTPAEGGGLRAAEAGATVSFVTDPGPWKTARIKLGGTVDPVWGVRLSRESQRATFFNLDPGVEHTLSGEQLPGTGLFHEPLRVEIFPRGEPGGGALLNRISLRLSAYEKSEPMPGPIGGLYAALLPLALACFLFFAGRRTLRQAAMASGMIAGIAVAAAHTEPSYIRYLVVGTMSFFLGSASGAFYKSLAAATEDERRPMLRRAAEWTGLAAVIGFAIWTRLEAMTTEWSRPLLPDARGYLQIAWEGTFYATAQEHAPYIREPLFPALLRMGYLFLPDTSVAGRWITLFVGVAMVVATWAVGRRIAGPIAGLLAAGFLAVNPWLAQQSVSLLRDDAVALFFLLLLAAVVYTGERRWLRAVAVGLGVAALALVRLNGLLLLPIVVAIEAYRRRWSVGEIVLAVVLAVVPVVPHLVYNARMGDGDFLYSANVHTRFYLNWDMIGEPGFPADRNAWEDDPYAGGVTGFREYAGHLGAVETARRLATGWVEIFVHPFASRHLFGGRWWLMIFGLVGAVALLLRCRETWPPLLLYLVFLVPVAFIAGSRMDPRLALVAAPLAAIVWGAGVAWCAQWVVQRLTKKDSPQKTLV